MKSSTKKKLISIIQLVIGVSILFIIFSNIGDKDDLLKALKSALNNWPQLLIGMGGFAICLFFVTIRWETLLHAQGINFSFKKVYKLYYIGHFFNSFLFGATGGDLVKAYIVTKEAPDKKTAAVATVFIDRIIGLLGLVILAVTVMLFRLDLFLSDPKMKLALIFNIALLLGTISMFAIVFRKNLLEKWSFFRKLEEKTALGKIITKVYNSFHLCVSNPKVLFKALGLSILNHIMLVTCCFYLGMALEVNLAFIDYLALFPVINAVAAIPLTPGGLGTREAAAVYLLGIVNVPDTRALSLSLLVYLTVLTQSIVGGFVYFSYVYHSGKIKTEELAVE